MDNPGWLWFHAARGPVGPVGPLGSGDPGGLGEAAGLGGRGPRPDAARLPAP